MKTIFVTGTDTNIGKTFICNLLLKEFNAIGLKTFAIKPLVSGCHYNNDQQLQNDDVIHLQASASIDKPYQIINPIPLEEPIAPHLAARKMGIKLSKSMVKKSILSSLQQEADINIIEGVGGWLMPLNEDELFSDVIDELKIPVILVVGIKLGCLNHALLTYKNIMDMGAPFLGWIANCLDPHTLSVNENIKTLKEWIHPPCLGIVPYNCQTLGYINIDVIQQFLF